MIFTSFRSLLPALSLLVVVPAAALIACEGSGATERPTAADAGGQCGEHAIGEVFWVPSCPGRNVGSDQCTCVSAGVVSCTGPAISCEVPDASSSPDVGGHCGEHNVGDVIRVPSCPGRNVGTDVCTCVSEGQWSCQGPAISCDEPDASTAGDATPE